MTPSSCHGVEEQAGYHVCHEMLILRMRLVVRRQRRRVVGQAHQAAVVLEHRLGPGAQQWPPGRGRGMVSRS